MPSRLFVAAVIVAAAFGFASSAQAAGSPCMTSGPTAGSYTITVCLTAPADGAIVAGDNPVTATFSFAGTGAPAGIQRMIFYLDGQYLLTDYSAPYTFTLPSAKFVDGQHLLEAEALDRTQFRSARASVILNFSNNVLTPPINTNSFTPTTGTTPPAGSPTILAAVGDGAGGEQSETDVVSEIKSWNPNLFLYLGDVYEQGSPTEFYNWYRPNGFFGGLRPITDPTVGNHEYTGSVAPGYFDYWDNVPHYFSVNVGNWHIISLDSTGNFGQLTTTSAQYAWLQSDLASDTSRCTMAYWHHPLFNIGQEPVASKLADIWALLASKHVQVVFNGHDHTYQRYVPLDGAGNPLSTGVTEIVAGTGGHAAGSFVTTDSRLAASATGFGAMQVQLNVGGLAYAFITTAGQTLDSGSIPCSTQADVTAPAAPRNVTTTPASDTEVDLAWNYATDNVGVTNYEIWRNGVQIATTGIQQKFVDNTVVGSTTYKYQMRSRDATGIVSGFSPIITVTTPSKGNLFQDGFESGDLSKWTANSGAVVQHTQVYDGSSAAECTVSSAVPPFASSTLASTRTELYALAHFKVLSIGSNAILLRMRTAANGALANVFLSTTGRLELKNDTNQSIVGGTTGALGPLVAVGGWHTLMFHVKINDTASQVDVWLDGAHVDVLSGTQALGTVPIGKVELCDSSLTAKTFDIAYDDVAYDPAPITDTGAPSTPANLTAAAPNGLEVDLAWTGSIDDVGVTSYDVYRNGALVGSAAGSATSWVDSSVSPGTAYSYQLRARDGAGNQSPFSNTASVTTPPGIFSDTFESGDLSHWSSSTGLVAEQQVLFSGAWGVRATSAGVSAFASETLAAQVPELYGRIRFELLSQGANSIDLLRFRTAANAAIVSVFISSSGKLSVRNDAAPTAITTTSTTSIVPGRWYELQLHADVGDVGGSNTDVWLNGAPVPDLSLTDTLGTTQIQKVELGESATGRTFDVAFDDVVVDTGFIPDTFAPTAATLTAAATSGTSIHLSWTGAVDNDGIVSYQITRDGSTLATVPGSASSYDDTGLASGSTHAYTITATDGAGNVSPASNVASATTASVDSSPPSTPANVAASAFSATRIDVSWDASTDNVGVTGYVVYRDGLQVATTDSATTSYSDLGVGPQTSYSYTVAARDAAGNTSAQSAAVVATTPKAPLFSDGFESGDLSKWASLNGLAAQQGLVYDGAWAARATSTAGTAAYAYAPFLVAANEIYAYTHFQVVSQGVNTVDLLKLRTASAASIGGLILTSGGNLGLRNDVAAVTTNSSVAVSAGAWHTVEMHLVVGNPGLIEVFLDGNIVPELSGAANTGTTAVAKLQLGENATGRTYDVAYDDVDVESAALSDSEAPTAPSGLTATAAGANEVDLSWTASTDNVGVSVYTVYRDNVRIGTVDGASTTFADTTAAPSTTYAYTVSASDAAGNVSLPSNAATATTPTGDTTPPTTPSGVSASAVSATQIDVSWNAATDNIGVSGYTIYRNGIQVGTVDGSTLAYSDTSALPRTTYSYAVKASDAAGNSSPQSLPATVTTPGSMLFSDDFESGDLSKWSTTGGLVAEQDLVGGGSWAARATSTAGTAAYAYATLAGQVTDLYYRARFQIVSQGATTVNLMKFRTSGSGSLGGLILTSGGNLGYRNDIAAVTTNSGVAVTRNVWHEAVVHIVVGTAPDVDVWLDGAPVAGLMNLAGDNGTNAVAKVQLGENTTGRTFDIAFDDVAVTSPSTVDTLAPSTPANVTATSPNSSEIDLNWNASTDDVGVVGYRVFRNAQPLATVLAPATTYADTAVTFGTSYTYTVEAYDAAGNTSLPSVPLSATPKDTTPPTSPSSFTGSGLSDTSIQLTWGSSTDDIGVTGYTLSRDGAAIAQLGAATLAYTDTGLAPNTPHTYTVTASDAAGNVSAARTATASTLPDTTPPTAPANLAGTPGAKQVALTWSGSTDDVAVTGYRIFRNGVQVGSVSGTTLAYTDTGLADVTTYTYTVKAADGAGNLSLASNSAAVKTLDSTPPTAPTSLHTTSVTATQVVIAWTASTDNVGVTAYNVYRNGTKIASVSGTTLTYTNTGVAAGQTYTYTVTASDAAANESAASNAVTVTIGDTSPPTAPTALAGTTAPGAVNLTWTAATDNVGVTGYRIFRNNTQIAQIGALTTYSDTTVASATAYTYFVRALDAAGNVSPNSNQISITSADTTAPAAPTGLVTSQVTASAVGLSWTAATDNVGVAKYTVFRNGVKLADVTAPALTYTDSTVSPQTSYSYTVSATDAAGNQSAPSTALSVRVPLFGDGFEIGNMSLWTSSAGYVVGTQRASSGTRSTEANAKGNTDFAAKTLTTTQTNLYLTARVFVASVNNKQNLDLLRYATAANGSLVRVGMDTNNRLFYVNGVTGTTTSSTTTISMNAWHTLELHVVVNGTTSTVEVWLDGTKVTALSKTDSLGTTAIGRAEIGQSLSAGTYDVFYDDVRIDTVQ